MAIMIKTAQEIEKMRRAGVVLRQVHEAIRPLVVEGASTMDLEVAANAKIDSFGAKAAFKGYHGFPAALCTSLNEQVVHGMPNAKTVLKSGDILSIDCGVVVDGFYSDCAVTYPIGDQSAEVRRLLEVTQASLEAAILQAVPGGRLFDISATVQEICEREGFGVVREFVGHGIGKAMHEDPQLPNFGTRGKGPPVEGGDGTCDRADDQRGWGGGEGAEGRLDGGDGRRELQRPLRAYGGDHEGWAAGFDPVACTPPHPLLCVQSPQNEYVTLRSACKVVITEGLQVKSCIHWS